MLAIASSLLWTTACSSSPAVARAFVASQVGSANGNACVVNGMALEIGSVPGVDAPVTRINNGGSDNGPISVNCRVHESGGEFQIALNTANNATVGAAGGSLEITGTVGIDGGTNINSALNTNGSTFEQPDCTVTPGEFKVTNGAAPAPPAVAPGRIWGVLSCPSATLVGSTGSVCDVEVDFIFENCVE